MYRDRYINTDTYKQTLRQREKNIEKQRQRNRDKNIDGKRETQRQGHGNKYKETDTYWVFKKNLNFFSYVSYDNFL